MRRSTLAGGVIVFILLFGIVTQPYVQGLSLVVRAGDLQGPVRDLAELDTVHVSERIVSAPITDISTRARVYAPTVGEARQTVLLVSGLHPAGIDEPRLIALARTLAE